MKKRKANYAKKAGMPPESLVYTGNKKPSPAEIELLVYDEATCEKSTIGSVEKMASLINKNKINLISINNLTDITLIENIGKYFSIHPMILEDVLNTSHLPKVEESGNQIIITLKLLDYPVNNSLEQQHISILLGDYYVIVFKDFENKIFEDLKVRIQNNWSKARLKKTDYLFYLLIDTLIDTYYNIVNEIDNRIDSTEELLLEEPDKNYINDIYYIKRPLSVMRGVLYPTREAMLNIVQGDFSLIEDGVLGYMQDVCDHLNQLIQMHESTRDTLSDLIELNSSNINNRLNGSMKILTIITTLFMPLTLIAGIYGMNFVHMPELTWKFGYPFSFFLMLITAALMLYVMKRNKLF